MRTFTRRCHRCPGGLELKGSFQVPLNYAKPISSSNSASIALIRTLSPYPPTSQNYKGPLIFNPGGPGGSGVDIVLGDGGLLREYIGDAFDILSFDPRGSYRFHASYLCLIHLSFFQASLVPPHSSPFSTMILTEKYGMPGQMSSVSSMLPQIA